MPRRHIGSHRGKRGGRCDLAGHHKLLRAGWACNPLTGERAIIDHDAAAVRTSQLSRCRRSRGPPKKRYEKAAAAGRALGLPVRPTIRRSKRRVAMWTGAMNRHRAPLSQNWMLAIGFGGPLKTKGAPKPRQLQRPRPRGAAEQHLARRPYRGAAKAASAGYKNLSAQVGRFSGSRLDACASFKLFQKAVVRP